MVRVALAINSLSKPPPPPPPAKDDEDEFSSEEFSTENFNMLHSGESNNYNNNLYSDNYNNNNGYSKSNLEGYTIEPQGMSDTRSLENGKYYYDIKNENYNTNIGDESVRENSNEGGYYNKKSKNEFDSMEEYERKEGYPDIQRDQYIP
ncbi:Uncharacterized protein Adt_37460 [Abeliophyllum distichum]|uniref:Uncharacterized protein n=1 Tax=Abeliophyllum distichum TaxID=126358 RepID=A0ABD1QP65_9LAMI